MSLFLVQSLAIGNDLFSYLTTQAVVLQSVINVDKVSAILTIIGKILKVEQFLKWVFKQILMKLEWNKDE